MASERAKKAGKKGAQLGWRGWREKFWQSYNKWMNSAAEHRSHRNQIFYSAWDCRAALLMATVINPRPIWRMGTMLLMYGMASLIPYFLSILLLIPTVVYTELYAGYFPGTGIVGSVRRAFPIVQTMGFSFSLFGCFQILRDFGDLVSIFSFALSDHEMDLCKPGANEVMNKTWMFQDSKCISLQMIGDNCARLAGLMNASVVSGRRLSLSPPHAYYAYEEAWKSQGTFSLSRFFIGYVLIFSLAALSSICNRVYTRCMKWILLFTFLAQLGLLLSTWKVRSDLSGGCPEIFSDLRRMLEAGGSVRRMVTTPGIWVAAFLLAVEVLGCGLGQITALGRRMAQGKLLYPHLIWLSIAAAVVPIVWGYAWMMAAPTFAPLTNNSTFSHAPHTKAALWGGRREKNLWYVASDMSQFEQEWPIRLHPWIYTLKARFTLNLLWGRGDLLFWLLVITLSVQTSALIFYHMDSVRVGLLEVWDWWNVEAWAERRRPWLTLWILVVIGVLASIRCIRDWRHVEELIRWSGWELNARVLLCICLLVFFWHIYGRVASDMSLVTLSQLYRTESFLTFHSRLNKYVFPIFAGFFLIMAFACPLARSEWMDLHGLPLQTWHDHYFPRTAVSANILKDVEAELLDANEFYWGGVVNGGLFWSCIPLLILGGSTAWLVIRVCYKGGVFKQLRKPTRGWGPSEVRFWKGHYQPLYHIDGMLEEEKHHIHNIARRKKQGKLHAKIDRDDEHKSLVQSDEGADRSAYKIVKKE